MSAAALPEALVLPERFDEVVGLTVARRADAEIFREMLTSANRTMNLVGGSTLGAFWSRHFVDSAQLLWFAPRARLWADLGAGAGFPGVVLAILLKGRENAKVHLIESVAKRCRFLEEVVTALELPAEVHNVRAESLALKVEVVTARACAPLDRLLDFAHPYITAGARGLFLKGANYAAEIADARPRWDFEADALPSLTDIRGRIIAIAAVSRARRG